MWRIQLSQAQKKELMDLYFKQEWDRVAEEDTLNLKDAYRFVKDIMTIPILKKDPIVQFTVEHNESVNALQ